LPRHLYESDVRTCIELAESGDAVALCQSSFRPPPGLVSVPITGTPLRWRHLLGWRPDSPAGRHAKTLVSFAVEAYREAVDRLPRLRAWLGTRPCYGGRPAGREPAVWGARHDVCGAPDRPAYAGRPGVLTPRRPGGGRRSARRPAPIPVRPDRARSPAGGPHGRAR